MPEEKPLKVNTCSGYAVELVANKGYVLLGGVKMLDETDKVVIQRILQDQIDLLAEDLKVHSDYTMADGAKMWLRMLMRALEHLQA